MASKQLLWITWMALATAAVARSQATWVALDSPSLCRIPSSPTRWERLERGAHVLFENEASELLEHPEPASITISNLLATLQVDASRKRTPLKFLPSAPPLIASGDPAALAELQSSLADLDRFGRALDVELRALWVPGRFDLGSHPAGPAVQSALGRSEIIGQAVARSGERAQLGLRHVRPFVAGYLAEVANNSGVAEPSIGRVLSGRTLHVRACRVRGGRAVHIEGFFDVANLVQITAFDPGTRDLGERVELPLVDSVQLAFSGVVESGGWLAASIEGPAWCSGSLLVQATTQADPADARGWRGFDLALLESKLFALPKIAPESYGDDNQDLRVLREPVTSSLVAQMADESSRDAKAGLRTSAIWSPGCLVVPAGETAAIAEISALVNAVELERTRGYEVFVEASDVKVRLPSTDGGMVRAAVLRESTHVADYDALVAQEIWMPLPRVMRVLDGWTCDGFVELGTFDMESWWSVTGAKQALSREQTGIGALELLERSHRSGHGRLASGTQRELLSPTSPATSLRVRFEVVR